jgi:hypothetical protein
MPDIVGGITKLAGTSCGGGDNEHAVLPNVAAPAGRVPHARDIHQSAAKCIVPHARDIHHTHQGSQCFMSTMSILQAGRSTSKSSDPGSIVGSLNTVLGTEP